MSDTKSGSPPKNNSPTTSLGDRGDAETAIGILVACRQDVDALERAISPTKRTAAFSRALASLRQRIDVGDELREARRGS